jgi:hypothetical protein
MRTLTATLALSAGLFTHCTPEQSMPDPVNPNIQCVQAPCPR